jgi:hypothetical protein
MWRRLALVLVGLIGFASAACGQTFSIDEVTSASGVDVARLKADAIAFSDRTSPGAVASETALMRFDDWAQTRPVEKKFLALFPTYSEPTLDKVMKGKAGPDVQKLYIYVAQARFVIDRAPGAIDLAHYITPAFLEKIDPAIKHRVITAADVVPFTDEAGMGNANPDRKWCTGRTTSACIQSTYKLEGKIPLGIMLVNKLRDSPRKIADDMDFQSELSALAPAEIDQNGFQELTKLNTPVSGVLEQNIFYVNQIMKFGKFCAVFQNHPSDPNKTVVTAFMSLAIKANVLDEKREFEKMPVLRNLVPAQVLMGQSSFNSGDSISAGLPKYARNEIRTIAGILQHDAPTK